MNPPSTRIKYNPGNRSRRSAMADEPRRLEVKSLYILVNGMGQETPVMRLEQIGFDPNHLELELTFTTYDNKIEISLNQNRIGTEDATQICDIRPVSDQEAQNGRDVEDEPQGRTASDNP